MRGRCGPGVAPARVPPGPPAPSPARAGGQGPGGSILPEDAELRGSSRQRRSRKQQRRRVEPGGWGEGRGVADGAIAPQSRLRAASVPRRLPGPGVESGHCMGQGAGRRSGRCPTPSRPRTPQDSSPGPRGQRRDSRTPEAPRWHPPPLRAAGAPGPPAPHPPGPPSRPSARDRRFFILPAPPALRAPVAPGPPDLHRRGFSALCPRWPLRMPGDHRDPRLSSTPRCTRDPPAAQGCPAPHGPREHREPQRPVSPVPPGPESPPPGGTGSPPRRGSPCS